MIEWFSSLEPGPASAWVAIAVASVFGVISAVGVGVTLRAYRDGVRERRVSTARVVWAGLNTGSKVLKGGEQVSIWGPGNPPITHLAHPSDAIRVTGGAAGLTHATRRVLSYVVEVHNESEEPISEVSVTASYVDNEGKGVGWLTRSIKPKSTESFRVTIAIPDEVLPTPTVLMSFTDSAGIPWVREDLKPPQREYQPRFRRG